MRFILFALALCVSAPGISQDTAVKSSESALAYQFKLQKNFFRNELEYNKKFREVAAMLDRINVSLSNKIIGSTPLKNLVYEYNSAEAAYRVVDLYLFLRYVTNTTDEQADRESDSLRNLIRITRRLVKQYIVSLPQKIVQAYIKSDPQFAFYVSSVLQEKGHILKEREENILQLFQYVKDPEFYTKARQEIAFGKVKTLAGEVDVFRQMSAWQSDPDEQVRRKGQIELFKGYTTKREVIGQGFIAMIRGLNAFSKARNFSSLIEEKLFSYQLSPAVVNNIFSKIIASSALTKNDAAQSKQVVEPGTRFTIREACQILTKAFEGLGKKYSKELNDLLNPDNGRMDITGGSHRYPIRGTASVYPVRPSVFYAYNYEGYLIDLVLLAHESGHAVQASLMENNKVAMLYGAGPGYFTESFGKFNELLLFDYLSENEEDTIKKKVYIAKLQERIDVLYGSAEEAYIEYTLLQKIGAGKIKTPDDLDEATMEAGSAISPRLYRQEPERKGLWMLLETDFYDPMHNINDMIGAALAISYYKMYKENKAGFIPAYIQLLSDGYHDTPATLLRKVNIKMDDSSFIDNVLKFCK